MTLSELLSTLTVVSSISVKESANRSANNLILCDEILKVVLTQVKEELQKNK